MNDIAALLLMGSGVFFLTVGVIGVIRMPSPLARIHATTKCDTLGGGLVLLGLLFKCDAGPAASRLIMILVFLWLTNPTGSHLLARAVHRVAECRLPEPDNSGRRTPGEASADGPS